MSIESWNFVFPHTSASVKMFISKIASEAIWPKAQPYNKKVKFISTQDKAKSLGRKKNLFHQPGNEALQNMPEEGRHLSEYLAARLIGSVFLTHF